MRKAVRIAKTLTILEVYSNVQFHEKQVDQPSPISITVGAAA